MPTPDEMRATLRKYIRLMCESDAEGMVELFAEDAAVEDPAGSPPLQGREALLTLYRAAAPNLQVEISGPICVVGLECAMPLLVELNVEGTKNYFDAIDVMAFDQDGKLNSMRAFWNPAEMRSER